MTLLTLAVSSTRPSTPPAGDGDGVASVAEGVAAAVFSTALDASATGLASVGVLPPHPANVTARTTATPPVNAAR
ncbi:hypothetical protein ACIQM4_18035 [Streptomyces sp. NPDC091272]|uniref:hypothetical protein n=1 Tax=Streptomyces sp. NPDC091272 TaxID=3365981 RepID=UPI00381E7E28